MTWLALARAALDLALDEWRDRRAADQARSAFIRGLSGVMVTCDRCGARVPAEPAAMSAHWSAHSNQKQDRS